MIHYAMVGDDLVCNLPGLLGNQELLMVAQLQASAFPHGVIQVRQTSVAVEINKRGLAAELRELVMEARELGTLGK